jgi:hypothetical protein
MIFINQISLLLVLKNHYNYCIILAILLFILYFNTFHDNSLVNKIKLLNKVSKYYLYYKIPAQSFFFLGPSSKRLLDF